MKRFFLGAYWSARADSLDECCCRLSRMFSDLCAADDSLADWYELAESQSKAKQRQADVASDSYIRRLLKRGRNWSDSPRTVMKDLGFSFGLWNGQDEPTSAGLSVRCGLCNEELANCVTLHLPQDLGKLSNVRRMRRALETVADAWEPDWAGVMSEKAMARRGFDAAKPFVDWMLYVSAQWLPNVPTFEAPASTERLAAGTIIVVQDEPPDPDDPTHMENITRVYAALRPRVMIPT